MHPNIERLAMRLKYDFPNTRLVLVTNGKKLLDFPDSFRSLFARIHITAYGEFNRAIIERVVSEENVFVEKSPAFLDPNITTPVSVEQARWVHKRCTGKVVRFVDKRIYSCCLAEGIEREYSVRNVFLEIEAVSPGSWISQLRALPHYQLCQYCYYAPILLQSKRERARVYVHRWLQYFLKNSPFAGRGFRLLLELWRYRKTESNWYNDHDSA